MIVQSYEREAQCNFCTREKEVEVLVIEAEGFPEPIRVCSKHVFALAKTRNGGKKPDSTKPFGIDIPKAKVVS